MYMNYHDLFKCTTGLYSVCPADQPILLKQLDTCTASTFLKNTLGVWKTCRKLILPDGFAPVFIRSLCEMLWVYSLSKPLQTTWRCQVNTFNFITKSRVLNQTGLLKYSQACHIFSDLITLRPISDGFSKINLKQKSIAVSSSCLVFSPQEVSLIRPSDEKNLDISKKVSSILILYLKTKTDLFRKFYNRNVTNSACECARLYKLLFYYFQTSCHLDYYYGHYISLKILNFLLVV